MNRASVTVTRDVGPVVGAMLRDAAREVLARQDRCLLAVPGGTTPAPVFAWLAAHVDVGLAARLTVIPVDERHLPLPDAQIGPSTWADLPAESNARLLWEHWLSRAAARPAWLPLDARGSLGEARDRVDASLPGDPDVVFLGLGPDGHVASLFPGHPGLGATGRLLAVSDSPKPPPERLTFTRASLARAHTIVVVATGAGKADAVRRAADGAAEFRYLLRTQRVGRASGPAEQLPLTGLTGPNVRWVLDPEAAAHLPELPESA